MMLDREEAVRLLKKYLKNQENINLSLAVEAVMRRLSRALNENVDLWGITGLLHNVDYEYTSGEPEKRGTLAAQLVEGLLPDEGVDAIKANNYIYTDQIPITALDKALISSSTAVRFIREIIRSSPNKDIHDVDLELVIKKFNDSSFGVKFKRSRMELCSDLGIKLSDFFDILLTRLKEGMVEET